MNQKKLIINHLQKLHETDEKKVVMNMKQYQDSGDKLPKDTVVKIVDETDVNVKPKNLNNPKVEKLVTLINTMINDAIDSDGDPIGVVDTSTTWEEPMIYSPIIYRNGVLKITSRSEYGTGKESTETILKRNMEFDGIPTLLSIKKQYTRALKKKNNVNEEDGVSDIGVNPDKLRADVQKFMDKLKLAQFESLFAKIDKPIEQAEMVAAFGERIGIPREKLPMILQSLKSVAENVKPRMKKSELIEHVLKNKK